MHIQAGRRFVNSKGSSLAELMVSVAVSIIITGIASFAFLNGVDVYLRMIRQYEAETEMVSVMYAMRSTFVSGVNVVYGGGASAAQNATTSRASASADLITRGRIFSIDDANPATTYTGDSFLVAQLDKEMSAAGLQSDFFSVQMVYQRPNSAGNISGALYIDQEKNTTAGGGWSRLYPVNAPQMFTRLTNFELNNIKVLDTDSSVVNVDVNNAGYPTLCKNAVTAAAASCVNRPVLSAEVTVVMRYFTSGREQDWRWCNFDNMGGFAGCTIVGGAARYRDLERKMTVVFANNPYNSAEYLPKRPFGNLYFFRPWRPLKKN